jgi:hypothetical protein
MLGMLAVDLRNLRKNNLVLATCKNPIEKYGDILKIYKLAT